MQYNAAEATSVSKRLDWSDIDIFGGFKWRDTKNAATAGMAIAA